MKPAPPPLLGCPRHPPPPPVKVVREWEGVGVWPDAAPPPPPPLGARRTRDGISVQFHQFLGERQLEHSASTLSVHLYAWHVFCVLGVSFCARTRDPSALKCLFHVLRPGPLRSETPALCTRT